MSEPLAEPAPRTRRWTKRPTWWVLAGSLAAGVGAYVFQVLGTRGLGEEAYAPIGVLWTLQYLTMAVPLIAVEAYVTRLVARQGGSAPGAPRRPLRALRASLVATAVVLGGGAWLARDALFDGFGDLAVVLAALVLAYGGFVIARGQMAGSDRFRSYGAATALESLARMCLAVPVVWLVPGTRPLAWILPVGPLLVVAWWRWDRRGAGVAHERPDRRAVAPVPVAPPEGTEDTSALRFLAITTTANGAAQALLAAGPLLLIPLGAPAAEISVFFVTVTLARAPLHFALGGLLSRLLPPLTQLSLALDDRALRRVALRLSGATVVVALLGAGAAWGVGPDVIAWFFGEPFRPGRTFATLTAAGVLLCTGALLLNQVLIARGSEIRLLLPWCAAVVCAGAVLLAADAGPTLAVAYGSSGGAVVAVVGLLLAVLTAPPLASAPAAGEVPPSRR